MEKNSVILGDCLDVMKGMDDNSVDLCLTDPPYGLQYDKQASKQGGKKFGNAAAKKKEYIDTDWDYKPLKEYFNEILRVSKECIIFGAEHLAYMLPPSRGWIVWDKNTGGNNFSDCELAYSTFDKPIKKYEFTWNGMIQERMGKNKEERFHPTQKPIQLFSIFLENYTKENDIIFDPFAGSGTTAISCLNMNRNYILVEKEKEYFDIINKRIEKHNDGNLLNFKG